MISLSSGQTVPSATSSFWVSCASLQQLFWLREEGYLVNHDLFEQWADGSQRHLQLLGKLRLPAIAVLVKRGREQMDHDLSEQRQTVPR
jgi:hypothetical protein